jgi:hypothetical protein
MHATPDERAVNSRVDAAMLHELRHFGKQTLGDLAGMLQRNSIVTGRSESMRAAKTSLQRLSTRRLVSFDHALKLWDVGDTPQDAPAA